MKRLDVFRCAREVICEVQDPILLVRSAKTGPYTARSSVFDLAKLTYLTTYLYKLCIRTPVSDQARTSRVVRGPRRLRELD